MGSRLCQAQGDPGRVDSAPTGLFDQNGGDDVDRRDSGGRGQGLWPRTPELRKRPSARCAAVRGRRHLYGWQRLSRKADRKTAVEGKGVSVRVDVGGRRIIKKKQKKINTIIKNKTR